MCGLAGFTRFFDPVGDESTLQRMGDAIAHRGPDAAGRYLDEHVGFCHRRLSIIDLSEAGNQPMFSADGNLVMIYNGEIYNFIELRKELERGGYHFRTRTDSEVILALYGREGEACLEKLNGMFAIAIWDRKRRELFLARDRLGKKPLYYYSDGKRFAFASEIKAILELPSIPRTIREEAVRDFFAYQYVPDDKTIFRGFEKLAAGHWLKVTRDGLRIRQYWDLGCRPVNPGSESEIAEGLLDLLEQSTRQRMISDVPLGAFLSGGIDSGGIVALMSRNGDDPVTTCSIGFDEKRYDEIEFANRVANRYGTRHNVLTVRDNLATQVTAIAPFFDEPFADQSLVPTYFVSKVARQKVTVALAGDGGDENFAGYEKYRTDQIENRVRRLVPRMLVELMNRCLSGSLATPRTRLMRRAATLMDAAGRSPADGFYRTNAYMTDELWQRLCRKDFDRRLQGYHPADLTRECYARADAEDHLARILYTDIKTYLLGDILVKVDRMSMANSLEVRAPMLDYRVVEYAAAIPSRLKIHRGAKKYILKRAFSKLLPPDIINRPKMGFSVPLADWLRGDLKPVCEGSLFAGESGISQIFEAAELQRIWREHQAGIRDHSIAIWSSLMFELWWQSYMAR